MMKKVLLSLSVLMLAGMVFAPAVFAQAPAAGISDEVKKFAAMACGMGIAIAALGGALAMGRVVASALEGIARNPGAYGKVFTPLILGLALIESLVIYSLLISFLLFFKL